MLLFKYCKMISISSISTKSKDFVQMSNIIDLVMHICESISLRFRRYRCKVWTDSVVNIGYSISIRYRRYRQQVQTAAMPDNV